jgi:hypothetical protein
MEVKDAEETEESAVATEAEDVVEVDVSLC